MPFWQHVHVCTCMYTYYVLDGKMCVVVREVCTHSHTLYAAAGGGKEGNGNG